LEEENKELRERIRRIEISNPKRTQEERIAKLEKQLGAMREIVSKAITGLNKKT
jgi:hypothetical protein